MRSASLVFLSGRDSRSAGGVDSYARAGLLRARGGHLCAESQDRDPARRRARRGHSRGGGRGLPVFEYAPKRIKQATVGRGNADKNQVAFMIRALLGLTETPRAGCGGCARHRADASARAGGRPAGSARGRADMRTSALSHSLARTHGFRGRAGLAGKAGRGKASEPLVRRRAAVAGARAGLHDWPHAGPIESSRRRRIFRILSFRSIAAARRPITARVN